MSAVGTILRPKQSILLSLLVIVKELDDATTQVNRVEHRQRSSVAKCNQLTLFGQKR